LQPEQFEYNYWLAEFYRRQQLFDLALDHMQLAHKAREKKLLNSREDPRKVAMEIKAFHEQMVLPLERTVGLRLGKFKDETTGAKPLKKAVDALTLPYQEMNHKSNRVEQSRLGLGKKALDLLIGVDVKLLEGQEQTAYLPIYFNMLVEMGRADVLARDLAKEEVQKALPPILLTQYQLLLAGAIGDYEAMDKWLNEFEKPMREGLPLLRKELPKLHRDACGPAVLLAMSPLSGPALAANANLLFTLPPSIALSQTLGVSGKVHNDLFNVMTLRGIALVEAGETKRALDNFEAVLREAGEEYFFSERPIALRYRDLLREQAK
jgi:hypothetical protein